MKEKVYITFAPPDSLVTTGFNKANLYSDGRRRVNKYLKN